MQRVVLDFVKRKIAVVVLGAGRKGDLSLIGIWTVMKGIVVMSIVKSVVLLGGAVVVAKAAKLSPKRLKLCSRKSLFLVLFKNTQILLIG